jgi:MFS family permease
MPYTRTVFAAATLVLLGIALLIPLVVAYISHHYKLEPVIDYRNHMAVLGITMMLCGFLLFAFTLLVHGAVVATQGRNGYERD